MSSITIDNVNFAFAKVDNISTNDISKDFQAENGDTIRYMTRKDNVSIKVTIFMEVDELTTFKSLLASYDEHSIVYTHGGTQSLIGFIENKEYKRIMFADNKNGTREGWEVSFDIKESRR